MKNHKHKYKILPTKSKIFIEWKCIDCRDRTIFPRRSFYVMMTSSK